MTHQYNAAPSSSARRSSTIRRWWRQRLSAFTTTLALLGPLAPLACDDDPDVVGPGQASGSSSAATQGKPVDHLAPGELAPSETELFGLPVPRGMRVTGRFPDAAHAVGRVDPTDLSEYVREYVHVQHVQLQPGRTLFPKVVIKGADRDKRFRIEVVTDGPDTKLVVRDITPAPTPEGLTEAERWERAGMSPNGRVLAPEQMQ